MKYTKKQLLAISHKVQTKKRLTPSDISTLSAFENITKEHKGKTILKQLPVPLAIVLGFMISAFPSYFDHVVDKMPSWTNLPTPITLGLDYLWSFIGRPIDNPNIIYHIPNIILYSFGVLGIKKLFEAIERRNWLDKVHASKAIVNEQMSSGTLHLDLKKGHSVLFMGKGDYIGMQFILNRAPAEAVYIGEIKPSYSAIWNYYNIENGYDDLKTVIERTCESGTGEYMFFPVKDDQIFLPSPTAYDLSPHKLDIVCQDLRMIEKRNKWKPKRILIVGDKFHKSYVHSEDKAGKIKNSQDLISMETISKKYSNVTLLDPTDIVLKKILDIAKGRKIVFRATKEGIREYKERFYKRIEKLGYKTTSAKKGILTIGYDIFEDQTEQQTLAGKINDYYPVVLSKNVRDALVRNGYKTSQFIYVPELVLSTLSKKASEQ
jgi:hypothetical protein